MKKYIVVAEMAELIGEALMSLTDQVNKYISIGFEPIGNVNLCFNPISKKYIVTQAMIREEE